MDEPFGSVDEIVRSSLREEVKSLQQVLSKTICFVTHDIEEAFYLANRIVLMSKGRVEFSGIPADIIFDDNSRFTEEFFKTRGFAAYLNVYKVSDIKLLSAPMEQSSGFRKNITVHLDDTLMEAVRLMLVNNMDFVNVTDGTENVYSLKLSQVFQRVEELSQIQAEEIAELEIEMEVSMAEEIPNLNNRSQRTATY